jgi:hypothetical protein
MLLHRSLGDPEFGGDLLVERTGNDEPQHVALGSLMSD